MNLPVIDADMIGRAFPKVDMCLPYVYGAEKPSPAAVADARGNAQIVAEVESRDRLERLLRCLCIELGMFTASALSISGTNLHQYTCHDTVSQAWFLGRAILCARQDKKNVVDSLVIAIPHATILRYLLIPHFAPGWLDPRLPFPVCGTDCGNIERGERRLDHRDSDH